MIIWPIRETFSCLVIYSGGIRCVKHSPSVALTLPSEAVRWNTPKKISWKFKQSTRNKRDKRREKSTLFYGRSWEESIWVESLFLCKIVHVSTENDLSELANFHYRRHLCTPAVRRAWWSVRVYAHACEMPLRKAEAEGNEKSMVNEKLGSSRNWWEISHTFYYTRYGCLKSKHAIWVRSSLSLYFSPHFLSDA